MARILIRGDTAADWTVENPILAAREPAIETDTGRMKIGDGTTAWASLSYFDPLRGLPRLLSDGTWDVQVEASASTGVFTVRAVGPGPSTKLLTWNPSTNVVEADGKALATQEFVGDALVVGPVILV